MRFMVIVKATQDSEAGVMPSTELLTSMGQYNDSCRTPECCWRRRPHPTSKGVRVRCAGKERTVIDGPFAESKELLAGFWLLQVRSRDEVNEW
jgi:hypothetical protein